MCYITDWFFALNVKKRKQIKVSCCVTNNQRGRQRAYCHIVMSTWSSEIPEITKYSYSRIVQNRKGDHPESRYYFGNGTSFINGEMSKTKYYFCQNCLVQILNTEQRVHGSNKGSIVYIGPPSVMESAVQDIIRSL